MIELVKVEIFEIDCMVIFEYRKKGSYTIEGLIKSQLDYLENCNITDKCKLIKLQKEMNEPSEMNDIQILEEIKSQIKKGYIYDYVIQGEEYIKNYQDEIQEEI